MTKSGSHADTTKITTLQTKRVTEYAAKQRESRMATGVCGLAAMVYATLIYSFSSSY